MWANITPVISTGFINTVNDAVDSMPTASAITGGTYLGGQIGKIFHLDDFEVASVTQTTVATVWGGFFQYVKLASGATANPVVGQLLFWDATQTGAGIYQVTTVENPNSAEDAMLIAGVCLTSAIWTPGNYAFIQVAGRVNVQFRGTLTQAGAVGGAALAAGAGAGADNGFADTIATATDFTEAQVGKYLGRQWTAASSGGLSQVLLESRRLYML